MRIYDPKGPSGEFTSSPASQIETPEDIETPTTQQKFIEEVEENNNKIEPLFEEGKEPKISLDEYLWLIFF